MIMEGLAVMAVYGGFFAVCGCVAAVVWALFPQWFEEVAGDE